MNLRCFESAPILSRLNKDEREELLRTAKVKKYVKGAVICWQDEVFTQAAYINSGKVEWTMLSLDGKRQVIFKLEACDIVWAHSILDGKPMPASLEVVEDCELYLWGQEILLPIISKNPKAMMDVSMILLHYMRQVREVVYGFAFHPVASRLARLLIDHYQPQKDQPAQRNLTLDEMAETVGTTRELISRTLHRFAQNNMIEINRMEFVFTNPEKLRDLANQQ